MNLVYLFVHLVVACLVFGLLYWLATLVVGLLPPPIANVARVVLLVVLVLMAILFLLGEMGSWGEWGWGYRRHW
jgi:hypothetical protein